MSNLYRKSRLKKLVKFRPKATKRNNLVSPTQIEFYIDNERQRTYIIRYIIKTINDEFDEFDANKLNKIALS